MWTALMLLLLPLAAAYSQVVDCPHDALYSSIVSRGEDFCSSVVEDANCSGYGSSKMASKYDQSLYLSYCDCIFTDLPSPTASATTSSGSALVSTATPPSAGTNGSSDGTAAQTNTTGDPMTTMAVSMPISSNTKTSPTESSGGSTQVGWNSTSENQMPTGSGVQNSETPSSGSSTGEGTLTGGSLISTSDMETLPVPTDTASTGSSITSLSNTEIPPMSRGVPTGGPVTPPNSTETLPVPTKKSSVRGPVTSPSNAETPTKTGQSSSQVSVTPSADTETLPVATEGTTTTSPVTSTAESSVGGGVMTTITPTFLTPTGTEVVNTTEFTEYPPPFASSTSAASSLFTRITRSAAVAQETCYQLPGDPEGDVPRRAFLRNFQLRQQNATIPYPYVESIDFESEGIHPLYMTVRDVAGESNRIDISDKSRIAVVDDDGNSLLLDSTGIHFATGECGYSVSVTVDELYEQLQRLAGVVCSASERSRPRADQSFHQVLFMHDQCGNAITRDLRPYPHLRVGDTNCAVAAMDETSGRWEFACTFPGSDSSFERCQRAVKDEVVDFLLTDPFGGGCPDLPTVVTTLDNVGAQLVNIDALHNDFSNLGLSSGDLRAAERSIVAYLRLWDMLQQVFSQERSSPPGQVSTLEQYVGLYDSYRDFAGDVCDSLHAGDMPLKLGLVAGVTVIDALTTLSWPPSSPPPYNVTIQDSRQKACCAAASVSETNARGVCKYPDDALIANSRCVCGETVAGDGLAFEKTECGNFVAQCDVDRDCAAHPGFVCLTGSCCGGGVCVDPFACSQAGINLVDTSDY